MQLTPEERRVRLSRLIEEDEQYIRMKADYDPALKWFEDFTEPLPEALRSRLWTYPGMGYLMHHRALNLVCQYMQFPDEDCG